MPRTLFFSGPPPFGFRCRSPGGMEKPEDDFEQTHNVRIASKDTLFGGVVSRLQVRAIRVEPWYTDSPFRFWSSSREEV